MSSLHPEHYCLGGTMYIPCSWYLTFTIVSLWILISAVSCCFCWTVQPRVSTIINSWCSLDHWQNMKWGCYCYKVWEFLNSVKPCVSMFYYVEHNICFTFIAACTSHSLYLVWQYYPVILIKFSCFSIIRPALIMPVYHVFTWFLPQGYYYFFAEK